MEVIEKYIGLTKKEFSLLAGLYGIRRMVCFADSEAVQISEDRLQWEYENTIFDLCKKHLIEPGEDGFRVQQEPEELFRALKNADLIIEVRCKSDRNNQMCIYAGEPGNTVILRPGRRQDEYVRICTIPAEALKEYLKGIGVLPDNSLPEALLQRVCEKTGAEQTEQLLKDRRVRSEEQLWMMDGTELMLKMRHPFRDSSRTVLAVCRLPMEDELIVIEKEERQIMAYSPDRLLTALEERMEEYHDRC